MAVEAATVAAMEEGGVVAGGSALEAAVVGWGGTGTGEEG